MGAVIPGGRRAPGGESGGTIYLGFDGTGSSWNDFEAAVGAAIRRNAILEIIGVVRRPFWSFFVSVPPVAIPANMAVEAEAQLDAAIAIARDAVPGNISVKYRTLARGEAAAMLRGLEDDGLGGCVIASRPLWRYLRRSGRLGVGRFTRIPRTKALG